MLRSKFLHPILAVADSRMNFRTNELHAARN